MSWEDNVRKVVPYVPGEQPKVQGGIIKLNTNEFPYPPSPEVTNAVKNSDTGSYRLYPDTYAEPLRSAIADQYGLTSDQVFVGVGSDDVLSMAFLTFFYSDKPVIFADITYSFYDVWADVYRIHYELKPLDENLRIRKEDYFCENGGIVIANPNAPTGISVSDDISVFEEIIQANRDSIVIIDEAYIDFGGVSALPLIHKYDNLLIVQTFSKSRAFAGMRIGYAMGNEKLIKYLNDVKFSVNSYTMNRPSIDYGLAVLQDKEYFTDTVNKVIATREWTKKALTELGFTVTDSKTNFVFVTHRDKKAEYIFEKLKEKKIYVRHFKNPRIDNYLRISIGTDEDMKRLVKELKEII